MICLALPAVNCALTVNIVFTCDLYVDDNHSAYRSMQYRFTSYLDDVLMTYGQRYIYAGTEYCCSVYVFKLADDVALVMFYPCYSMDSRGNDFIL